MSDCYVDSSVLGAYYCPEPLSKVAQDFLRQVEVPVISLLTEVELFSLVAKKKRVGDFGERKARMILAEFQSHLESGYYRKTVPSHVHYKRAREMIGELRTALHTLDALHLAIAIEENLSLVTADNSFKKAAKQFGIEVSHLNA